MAKSLMATANHIPKPVILEASLAVDPAKIDLVDVTKTARGTGIADAETVIVVIGTATLSGIAGGIASETVTVSGTEEEIESWIASDPVETDPDRQMPVRHEIGE